MRKIPNKKICLNCIDYLNFPSRTKVPEPCIFAWYRDPKTKKRKKLTFLGFDPYFYASDQIRIPTYFYHKNTRVKENLVKRIESCPTRTSGQPMLKKVFTFFPHQVRLLRKILEMWKYYDYIFEADIKYIYRFMIDKKIKFALEHTPSGFIPIDEDIPSYIRYLFIDLEIKSRRKPNPKKLRKEEEIICGTLWDNYTEKYTLYYQYKTPLTIDLGPDTKVVYCRNERDLLRNIAKHIIQMDPDIISGFNIDWDLCALIKTMEQRHSLNPDMLSPLKKTKIRTSKKKLGDILFSTPRAKIWGRSILDLLEMYLMVHLSALEEMTLGFIAKTEKLPAQKIEVPDFWMTWENNPELIIKRNKEDVHIYVELEKKLNLIAFADEKRKLVGCTFEDTLSSKKMLDLFLLRMKGNKILPTARRRAEKYPGAFVYDPKPGLYNWLIQIDYNHLYPSIMMGFNIDPDSFVNPSIWKGPTQNLYILNPTHAFKKSPPGLLPTLLKTLIDLRVEKNILGKEALKRKDEMAFNKYKLQEGAVKVLANATYGVMGYRFRKGSKETVESVTFIGRALLLFAINLIERTGRKVIYGDTDSVFFVPKSNTLDDCLKEAKKMQALIIKELPKFLTTYGKTDEQPFDMAPAKIYSSFFILEKKKRYAGFVEWSSKRGTNIKYHYDIKGLETKRSDISPFGKKIQQQVIYDILNHQTKKEILKYLTNELNNFANLPLMKMGVPAAIGKPLKSYKGNAIQKVSAVYSNKHLKTSFGAGSKPKRIYIKTVPAPYPETHSLSIDWNVQLPPGFEIDYPKMLQVTIRKKIEKLLEIINIKWDDIKLKKELQLPIKKKRKKIKKKKLAKTQKTLSSFGGKKDGKNLK